MLHELESPIKNENINVIKDEERERITIREKLSSVSFEDLLKIKEQMGLKLYNETVFGKSNDRSTKDFKRANKNRPREMSSKLKYFKRVLNNNTGGVAKKSVARDPRFDPLCGEFDEKTFKFNYKFITEMRQGEIKQLEKELKLCTDPQRKNNINLLIQRMTNQIREQQKKEAVQKKEYEEKREIRKKLQEGEKPLFKKKSVKKLESLIEKYEELKKTDKLQKHMERRSKKLSSKERKKLKI